MKIPKLLPRKLTKPASENVEDDEDNEGEKGDVMENQESTENQTETTQDSGNKKGDNQAILRLLGEGEKVIRHVCVICEHPVSAIAPLCMVFSKSCTLAFEVKYYNFCQTTGVLH